MFKTTNPVEMRNHMYDSDKAYKAIDKTIKPHTLDDAEYIKVASSYMKWVTGFLLQNEGTINMMNQVKRMDIDTVCSIEKYELKKAVNEQNLLDFNNWMPEE